MSQVSLIIPLYNAIKYLKPCLDSVVAQTFKDFEVVIVDDGSTDQTTNIVEEYTSKYSNFKLISQTNAGVSSARNYGIETSTSPYIAFLDQDDILHPQAIEVLYSLISKHQTDASAFGVKTVSEDFVLENPKHYNLSNLEVEVIEHPVDSFFKNKKGGSIWVWNKLYRKEAIKGIFFPEGDKPAEDTVFSLKVLSAINDIAQVKTDLLYYRLSTTSVMKEGITLKYINSHNKAAQEIYDYFIKANMLKGKELNWFEFYLSRFIFKSLISQPLRKNKNNKDIVETSYKYAKNLYMLGAIKPELLGFKKNLACKLFFKQKYFLSKLFLK